MTSNTSSMTGAAYEVAQECFSLLVAVNVKHPHRFSTATGDQIVALFALARSNQSIGTTKLQ